MITPYTRNAIVLGLLSAIGPFAIDMYLPALPTIAADLKASPAAVQMTLMSFFVAFGVCQIVYGPVSDMVGRKPPLYAGLGLFIAGSIGCGLAPSIEWLIAFRFVQGVGASSVMVIPRAIIRDLHTGTEATRLMALVMLVLSVSPILAPLTGSALIVPFGWRAVFVAVTLVAVVGLVLLTVFQQETHAPEHRVAVSVRNVLASFGQLMTHGRFLGLTFIGGLGMASFFSFLAGSSFVYIEHFGLTPTQFSVAFAVNAVGFIGASQFAAPLGERIGMARMVVIATALYAAFTVALLVVTLMGVDSLPVMMALLLAGFTAMGVVIPSTMVLALEEHGPIAGMASALGGTLQMITGGVMIVIVSLVFDGTPLPMVAAIAGCAVGALIVSIVTLGFARALPHGA
ncbi:MAG: multidrug effflux MFS transporter [Pseudolabrys sp.]|nr:multidrug effflux MFS transporter [Pseudolabrys sp.]MCW5685248.1 multidrug effflux MFS transporter [Pseudolabrys sp.]